ncbi:MAG: hypothetical protein ABGW78_13755 [Pirellulales bacterium]
MKRFSLRYVAFITASSTMLLSMPLMAVAQSITGWLNPSVSAIHVDIEILGESLAEGFEEEREEEVESQDHFLLGRVSREHGSQACLGGIKCLSFSLELRAHRTLAAIRGPPSH